MAMNYKPDNASPSATPAACGEPVSLSLRRKIQIGFLLVLVLTVLTGSGLALHLTAVDRNMAAGAREAAASAADGEHEHLLTRVRYGLLGGTLLALAALITIYRFLVRQVLHPLEHTAAAARQMVDGHLDATVPVQGPDEIGRLGELFNDMGVNLQELILLVWNQTGSALDTLEGLNRHLENHPAAPLRTEIHAHLQSVRQNLGTMQTVARSFDLYDVLLTGRKAVALEERVDRVT
jgi:methyl-accepting chemotaxis protein